MSRPEDILVELREATREAAGILKDLRGAVKEACRVIDQLVPVMIEERLVATLNDADKEISAATQRAIADAEKAIHARFNRIASILLDNFGPTAKRGTDLPTMEEFTNALVATQRIMQAYGESEGLQADRLTDLVNQVLGSRPT